MLDFLCLKTSYWYVSFLVYNYAIFYACHKVKVLYRYRYILFGVFAIGLILFDYRIRAEQALSFVTGIWIAEHLEQAKRLFTSQYSLGVLAFSILCLASKQVGPVRMAMESNMVFENIMSIGIKYLMALSIISLLTLGSPLYPIVSKAIPRFESSKFLSFCNKASFELYLVHFSLIPILDKTRPLTTASMFIALSFLITYIFYQLNNKISTWTK